MCYNHRTVFTGQLCTTGPKRTRLSVTPETPRRRPSSLESDFASVGGRGDCVGPGAYDSDGGGIANSLGAFLC